MIKGLGTKFLGAIYIAFAQLAVGESLKNQTMRNHHISNIEMDKFVSGKRCGVSLLKINL